MVMFKNIKIYIILFSTVFISVLSPQTYSVNNIKDLKDALADVKNGDQIIINSGEYILSNTLKITGKSKIKIIGNGNVQILANISPLSCISIINSSDIMIKNLNLEYKGKKTLETIAWGIYLEKAENITVDYCRIKGFSVGIYSIKSQAVLVKACTISSNSQWVLYGNYKDLKLIDNDLEHNGGLFFINGKKIESVGITSHNIFMKNNLVNNNGSEGKNYFPQTVITSPLSQELKEDKNYEEGITGSSTQKNFDRELELLNQERIYRELENSDLFRNRQPLY